MTPTLTSRSAKSRQPLTPTERIERRRLIFHDTLALFGLTAISVCIAVLTYFFFNSFREHRRVLERRWFARGDIHKQCRAYGGTARDAEQSVLAHDRTTAGNVPALSQRPASLTQRHYIMISNDSSAVRNASRQRANHPGYCVSTTSSSGTSHVRLVSVTFRKVTDEILNPADLS